MFATMFVCGACLIGCVESREGGRIAKAKNYATRVLAKAGGLPSFVFILPSFLIPPLSPCFTEVYIHRQIMHSI